MGFICYSYNIRLFSTIIVYNHLKTDNTMQVERYCTYCQKKLSGRSDKKFCDDNCRNQFNNAKNQDDGKYIKFINQILKHNRKVLLQVLGDEEKIKVAKEKLRILHFEFKYFTHQYITQKGAVYHFCYEFGYLQLDEEKVLVVKRDPKD